MKKLPGVGGQNQVGLGGVFTVESGKIKGHAIPKLKDEDVDLPTLIENIQFFEAGPELTCISFILSGDPTGGAMINLPQHTHFFRQDGTEGGHFEEGISKEEIHYVGYFTPAGSVYKLNKPCGDV